MKLEELAGILQTSANSFRDMSAAENSGLFDQCSWLAETYDAIVAEFSHIKPSRVRSALLKACGVESGKSSAAMRNRYTVGRIFEGQYALDCDFSLHVLCASAKGVDINDPATYGVARGWLDTALAGFVEGKVKREHTTRTLRQIMRSADKNCQTTDKIYLCKRVEATIGNVSTANGVLAFTVYMDADHPERFQPNTDILLTIQLLPAIVKTTDELEAAA